MNIHRTMMCIGVWIFALVLYGGATEAAKPTVESLGEAAGAYWNARAEREWSKAYRYELNEEEESLEAYEGRMGEGYKTLPFQLLSVSEPVVDGDTGSGTVQVRIKYQFKFPARGDMEYVIRDYWAFQDGRWLHRVVKTEK